MRLATLVVVVVVAAVIAVVRASNVCRDTASCCVLFDFQRPSAWDHLPYSGAVIAVPAGAAGPWAEQGLEVSIEQNNTLTGAAYPLGLVNVSSTSTAAVGADHLQTATDGLVLSAFEFYPTTLLRGGTSTYRFVLRHQPACVASVRTLRSIEFNYRESSRATTYRLDSMSGTYTQVDQHGSLWSNTDRTVADEWEFIALHTDLLRVDLYGQGYGAVARVEVCYAAPQGLDACGVCGGTGAGCAAPGAPCVVANQSGACASGTLDDSMQCVPNLVGAAELCNGLDDNCNGLIDEGDWGVVACGIGACYRIYSKCISGQENSRCEPGSPRPEVCNGADDNCNGEVDEGGVCGVSPSPTAVPPSSTPSASPSSQPTPPVTPSATATPPPTPSASLVPRVFGAMVIPLATCVRDTDTPGVLQAVFGYSYVGGGGGATTLSIPVSAGANWLVTSAVGTRDQTQPSVFRAQTSAPRAFETFFAVAEQLQWRLNGSVAVLDASSRRCDTDSAYTLEPVQPLLFQCVDRVADECTARFGYYNPNAQTVQIDLGLASNWFEPAPFDRRQPRLFYPGALVANAFSVRFDCSTTADWTLRWTLVTGVGNATAYADAHSLC